MNLPRLSDGYDFSSVIRYPFNDHQLVLGVYILQVFAGQEVQTVKMLVQ